MSDSETLKQESPIRICVYKDHHLLIHVVGDSDKPGVRTLLNEIARLDQELTECKIPHDTWRRNKPDYSGKEPDGIVINILHLL